MPWAEGCLEEWECLEGRGLLRGHQEQWVGEGAWPVWEAEGVDGWVPEWEAGCSSSDEGSRLFELVFVWGSDWWESN